MAALRQPCPVKISLTLPAGVVLPVKKFQCISWQSFNILFPTRTSGDVGALCYDNYCICLIVACNIWPALSWIDFVVAGVIKRQVRSIDLSGLASTSVPQRLAASCLCLPAQMSEALSTSSSEVLNGQCVWGSIQWQNFKRRHQRWEYRVTIISWYNYRILFKISLKYRYRQNFEDITQYLIMKYWPISALHGPVKANLIV